MKNVEWGHAWRGVGAMPLQMTNAEWRITFNV